MGVVTSSCEVAIISRGEVTFSRGVAIISHGVAIISRYYHL